MSAESRNNSKIVGGPGISAEILDYANALIQEREMYSLQGQLHSGIEETLLPREWIAGRKSGDSIPGESTGK